MILPSDISRRRLLSGIAGATSAAAIGEVARATDVSTAAGPFIHDATAAALGYVRYGTGPVRVFVLHEWLGDHRNYNQVLHILPRDKCTFVFVDLRGYGLSKRTRGRYDLEEAISDVGATADSLGWDQFHLVGHSMSGLICQNFALKARRRVKSLFLCSPVPATGFHASPEAMAGLRDVIDSDATLEKTIDGRTGGKLGRGFIEFKARLARDSSIKEAMAGYLAMFTSTDFADEIAADPTVKDLVVTALCGDNDALTYRAEAEKAGLERAFGQSGNVQVFGNDSAGHYSMLEAPAKWAGTLEHHLARAGA